MMVILTLVFCLTADLDSSGDCQEGKERYEYYQMDNIRECYLSGIPEAAKFVGKHEDYTFLGVISCTVSTKKGRDS
jgi:hypothetical protein